MSRRRKPLRLVNAYDEYRIVTGSAGFVQLFKNGRRLQPKNFEITLRRRKQPRGDS